MKKGFTLAEFLITLGIIGVVAAMTIPTLINNYQKQEYVTSLKKIYSVGNQALKQMSIEEGCAEDLKCTGFFESGVNITVFGDALVKYFKVVKNCKTATSQGCWTPVSNFYYDGTSTINNSTYDAMGTYKFITADGMSISLDNYNNGCNSAAWSTQRTGNMAQTCGQFTVDINGLKLPNAYGRDTFDFYVTNARGILLYPRGGSDDNRGWGGTGDWWWKPGAGCQPFNKMGLICPGRVIEEGWKMNY